MVLDTPGALSAQFKARTPGFKAAANSLVSRDVATLDCQLRLAQVASPTGSERQRALFVQQCFNNAGWQTRISDAGNVIARQFAKHDNPPLVPSTLPQAGDVAPVVCIAHLDSVFPQATVLQPTRDGARYLCPGIGDNCRGLAAIITLAELLGAASNALVTAAPAASRPIEFVATVGEEGLGNLQGAKDYFAERDSAGCPRAHAAIVIDGPGDTSIVHHGLGSRRYHVAFRGAGGHSWADFGMPNAIHAAARAATWLAELPRTLPQRVAITVSRIGGGESINAIPADAWIDVDVRSTDESTLARVEVELRGIVTAAARAEHMARDGMPLCSDHGLSKVLSTSIVMTGARPTGSLPLEHPLVRAAQFATRLHGVEPVSAVASTDANVPLSLGIPAIAIGGGGIGGGTHTLAEWYENTNAPRGLARTLAIILSAAS